MSIPESLRLPGLEPLWEALRGQLDRNRAARPATVKRPLLDPPSERALKSLLGDGYRSRIELDLLERELVERRIGCDLDDVLTQLGYPASDEAMMRRVDAVRRTEARLALEHEIADWPQPWAAEWAAGIVASGNLGGLEGAEAAELAHDVARVVLLVTTARLPMARVDVAALVFGDAHALDPGLRRTNWVARALRHIVDEGAAREPGEPGDLVGRDLWAAAGLIGDRVSGPALVWGLAASGDAPAVDLLNAAHRRRVPVHLSDFALAGELQVSTDEPVLVVENPRVVEYAAERQLPVPIIAANGNPSATVQLLVDHLVRYGVDVGYHGDFDTAGLAICARMVDRGCRPWKMDAADYVAAVEQADARGVRLGRDERPCGPTPWDPDLASAFNRHRVIVHEEFVLPDLF